MSEALLKLTTYFGERHRTEHGRLLADELFDLYGRDEIESSVLLRGVLGFGSKHRLRTDRTLSVSEDLPIAAVAVDRREHIDRLLADVLAIKRRGLITLERARLLQPGDEIHAGDGDEPADGTKLTVYLGRQERAAGRPALVAACELLHRSGFSGGTVLLGVDGTMRGQRQRARFFSRNARVPTMTIAVGSTREVAEVVPELWALLGDPTITLERVRVCKRGGELISRPHNLPGRDEHGLAFWQKLTIHTTEDMRAGRHPLHLELVRRLRAARMAGATTLRGVWGFNGSRPPGGDRLVQLHRHVPVMTLVIDTPERIQSAFEIVDDLTDGAGVVTSEVVPAAAVLLPGERHGGLELAAQP